ncbi:hypothetical protein ACFR9U_19160 [Halorientalis brevis]|uniref:DUF7344 domain-containing protein n=1 Tax=Halorientalis brevis TaxID=1126241 RepID=A0ABD6CHN0_9EURY|nr:hypothetical protein [Halorientalis brevis]
MSGATQEPVSGRGAGVGPDSPSTVESETAQSLRREDAFEVLSNARRRHVIHYLLQQEDRVTLRDLSEQIAAWENDVEPVDVSSKQRKRVYTALRQSHLPKLDDKEIVHFDADRGTVQPTDRLSDLKVYMEVVPEHEIPWSHYYSGIGVISACVTVLSWTGLVPFSELPGHLLAGLTAGLVLVSGLVHAYETQKSHLGSDGPPPECRR